jgi:hypothetical protein
VDDETGQVPEEFRPACGRPGSRVVVRHCPDAIPHALCDLTGVVISYPAHGGVAGPSAAMLAAYAADPALAALRLDFTGTLREVLEVLTAGLLARKR